MKILFGFDAQFCGSMEKIINSERKLNDEDIKSMFPDVLGIPYDENCYYKIL